MRKKSKVDFFICFIIAILNVIFAGFCINEYFCDKYAIIEPKIIIANELNIKYTSKIELNKSLIVIVRNYSSLTYEDIRVTYEGNLKYEEFGSNINSEEDNNRYWKFVNSVDEYLREKENKTFFELLIICFGRLFVYFIYAGIVIIIILVFSLTAIYVFTCRFAKRKLSVAEYCRAIVFAAIKTLDEI